MDFAAAVHITASSQVPLGHGESRSGRETVTSFTASTTSPRVHLFNKCLISELKLVLSWS